ncbi:MAG: M20/M25/M40 family metallo-hydrolase [Candidatus Methanomethyliaceae archaeon]
MTFGERFAGTPGLEKAADFLHSVLDELDFSVDRQAFTIPRWLPKRVSLRVLSPYCHEIEARCFLFSPPTPSDTFEGSLRWLGKHRVWERQEWELFCIVDHLGAPIGLISGRPQYKAIFQGGIERPQLPHFIIGETDAEAVLARTKRGECLKLGGEISLDMKTSELTVSNNVYATIMDSRSLAKKRTVILVAHYDTVPGTPGAYDNASGVAATVELARRLREKNRIENMSLLLTAGEECNLEGSRRFCTRLRGANSDFLPSLSIVLDGIGRGTTLELWVTPDILSVVIGLVRRCKWDGDIKIITPPPPASDHVPFIELGIPTITITIDDQELLHSSADNLDTRIEENIEAVVNFAEEFVVFVMHCLGII